MEKVHHTWEPHIHMWNFSQDSLRDSWKTPHDSTARWTHLTATSWHGFSVWLLKDSSVTLLRNFNALSLQCFLSSLRFVGICSCTALLRPLRSISVRLRSSFCLGHWSTPILFFFSLLFVLFLSKLIHYAKCLRNKCPCVFACSHKHSAYKFISVRIFNCYAKRFNVLL